MMIQALEIFVEELEDERYKLSVEISIADPQLWTKELFVESLQSHCIHTQFHWSSGPPVYFLSWGTGVHSSGGYLSETRILMLALSHYIGDPDMINHCGVVWGGLHPGPSLGYRADNVIIPIDLHSSSVPVSRSLQVLPFRFTTDIVGCWGGALWRACNLTAFIHSSTGPVVHPFTSRNEGPGFNPLGSPVSIVSLHVL